MTLTASSSSRYRQIMTIDQWLETQESMLHALLEREKRTMIEETVFVNMHTMT